MPVTMYHNPRCNTSRRPGSTTDDAQRCCAPITIRLHLELDQLTPALSIQQSLYWHEHRSALVLDQEHQESRSVKSQASIVDTGEAPSPATARLNNRRNSNSSSISRPPRLSA